VHQYQWNGSTWDAGPTATVQPGADIGVSGDDIVVGASSETIGVLEAAGAVYFLGRGGFFFLPPGAPTGVSAGAGPGSNAMSVSWQPPAAGGSGIVGYVVTATSDTPFTSPTQRSVDAPGISVVLSELSELATYTVTVQAVSATTVGPPSAPSNAVTIPAPPAVASPYTMADTVGDAPSDRVDIVSARLSYDDDQITLAIKTGEVVDPGTDQLFLRRAFFRVSFEPEPPAAAGLLIQSSARQGGGPTLPGEPLIARFEFYDACGAFPVRVVGGAYQTTFPAACLGTPPDVRFGFGLFSPTDGGDRSAFSPKILRGPKVVPPPPPAPPTPPPPQVAPGYWMVDAGGHVYAFGLAAHLGDAVDVVAASGPGVTAVDLEPTPSGNGYWILASNGQLVARGDANLLGDASVGLSFDASGPETAVSISRTPSGLGYWIFTSRGRALAFGDALHYGDLNAVALNGPVLDSIPTPSGLGYYMVASDGGVFSFGDARFAGSMGGQRLNEPVISLVPDLDGSGYWLVARDGGVFAFDAGFVGSIPGVLQPGQTLNQPITGMIPYGDGYAMVAEDGGAFTFSTQPFLGSLGGNPPTDPITSIASR
jgi:hypothetical protein